MSDLIVSHLRSAFLTPKKLLLSPSKFVERDARWPLQEELLLKSFDILAQQVLIASDAEIRKNIRIIHGTKMPYCNGEFEDPKSIERFSYITYYLKWPNQLIPIQSCYRIYSPFFNCSKSQCPATAEIIIESNTDLLWNVANTNYRPIALTFLLVNTFDRIMGNYPLTLAVAKGHNHHCSRRPNAPSQREIIELLLPYADLQLREFQYGLTPLEIAIMRGDDVDFVEKLFKLTKTMPQDLETLFSLDYDTVKKRIMHLTCYNTKLTYEKTNICTISSYKVFLRNREKIATLFKKPLTT